jgi:hypothetical protein
VVNHVRVGTLRPMHLAFAFTSTVIGAFAWLLASIRCDRCGSHAAWRLLRGANAGSWLVELHTLTRCPSCGS